MLRVPDLQPGDESFNPDGGYAMHPKIRRSDHTLHIGGGEDSVAKDGAILSGIARDEAWRRPAGPEESLELQAIRDRNDVFDDATVRSALTDLHERGDDFERKLSELPGRQADEIGKLTDSFLKEQRQTLASQLTSDSQKRHFELGFDAFAGETEVRGKAMREAKTRAWQAEVTERQNRVFLNRALRSENVFNDAVQTGFRDMYLLNLENLHADLPESERKTRIDAANGDFCRQVLDKRLELDPARMRTMLNAPAVRRVLGEETMKTYETKATLAIRGDEIRNLSKTWSDAGVDPKEAGRKAGDLYPDGKERNAALEHYWNHREKTSRAEVTKSFIDIDRTWREVKAGGIGDNPRLGVLRHTDPDLAAHMEKAFLDQRGNGGAPAKPDYALLLELTDDFDPRQSAENLRDRDRLLEVYGRLGGSESPAFSTYLRTFLGQSTPEDASRLDSLRLARDVAAADRGGDISAADMATYLHRYSENSRIFMDRNGYKELDHSEKVMLARKAMGDMGWVQSGRDTGSDS